MKGGGNQNPQNSANVGYRWPLTGTKKRDDDICQMSKAKSFVTGPNIGWLS